MGPNTIQPTIAQPKTACSHGNDTKSKKHKHDSEQRTVVQAKNVLQVVSFPCRQPFFGCAFRSSVVFGLYVAKMKSDRLK